MGRSSLFSAPRVRFALLAGAMLSGCFVDSTVGEEEEGCQQDGQVGQRDDLGYCSYPDSSCPGGWRYGAQAPSGLADSCVPGDGTGTGAPDSTSTTGPSGGSESGPSSETIDATSGGSDTGGESSSTGATGEPVFNLAFVSSEVLSPSPTMQADADALCGDLAVSAGLPGTFRAWVSAFDSDARDRLAVGDVLPRGWVRTDGLPFTDALTDLLVGTIYYPLRLDEHGESLGAVPVITGTSGDGTSNAICQAWEDTTSLGYYQAGIAGDAFDDWTAAGATTCDTPGHVYCFGVDLDTEVVIEPVAGRLAFVSDPISRPDIGVAGFDDACRVSAEDAGLEGSFLALVATTRMAAISRFDQTGAPWVNPLGLPLTNADSELGSVVQLDAPIAFDASGNPVSDIAWGGAPNVYSVSDGNACGDWTNTTGVGWTQFAGSTDEWFGRRGLNCDRPGRVLCLEE